MLAIDNGTNSDYSTNGGAGFPVMHAAPLDKHPSEKGGPYSEGVSLTSGQFGLMTVDDEGETIDITWSGRNYKDEELLHYEFSVTSPDYGLQSASGGQGPAAAQRPQAVRARTPLSTTQGTA
jgi:hypothetical protein